MTRTLKHEKWAVLEIEEANLLLEIACFEGNAIPYARDDDFLYICPNLELQSLSRSDNHLWMVKKLNLYKAQMQVILDEVFFKEYRWFSKKRLNIKKCRRELTPNENDLVLIKSDKIGDHERYGVVKKLKSPQTLIIRLKNGQETAE